MASSLIEGALPFPLVVTGVRPPSRLERLRLVGLVGEAVTAPKAARAEIIAAFIVICCDLQSATRCNKTSEGCRLFGRQIQ